VKSNLFYVLTKYRLNYFISEGSHLRTGRSLSS